MLLGSLFIPPILGSISFIPLQLLGHDLERSRAHGTSSGMEAEGSKGWNEGLAVRWSSVGPALGTPAGMFSSQLSLGDKCMHSLPLGWSTATLKWQASWCLSPSRGGNPQLLLYSKGTWR